MSDDNAIIIDEIDSKVLDEELLYYYCFINEDGFRKVYKGKSPKTNIFPSENNIETIEVIVKRNHIV